MRVLCMGEALIDVIHQPTGEVEERVGGSIFNVARGLARLDLDTTLASWWGSDDRGKLLQAAAEAAGLQIIPGTDRAAQTSIARAEVDPTGHATYEFRLSWDLPDIPDADGYTHWHIGSFSALIPDGAAKIRELLDRRGPKVTVSYDPNVRPSLVHDLDQTRTQIEDLVKRVDIIKASDEDLDFLYPGVHRGEVAKQWLGGYWELRTGGPQLFVLTRGGQGAELYTPWLPAPLHVEPHAAGPMADTVGAGDSFMAGLLAGLADNHAIGLGRVALNSLDQEELGYILDLANRTAGITVTHLGSYSPRRAELEN